ncbi:uncharacterized protein PGTG_18968 [Puccinia graminis f. sp. tritici CRL 75-36-700-3]|uniref:Uncharacterized protein n=1 Tax=Puccinia graminis f. sp. tritici (strain CRL 75-36-700-3 / race SCCL) TaxID=418459 RepID=E3L8T0_PUCGT|nr:uncharacterized protein PGTG_18968 [Puccinia graminis f. sp. tritici CRL 75-36-700-3]EFP92955.1 hypothetical protein PGTG_18968 [Puccinia graminis f. sp. tritici CRL 75-36-700-3]
MAVEVNRLLKKDANHTNDISIAKNHIWCFCHKLALILNAGLKAILVPQHNQIPTSSVLGFVPGLCAISKESSYSSLAKQAEFNTWVKKLDYMGTTLIAGYGIQWNINFKSCEKVYITRNVINKLIENEQDRQDHEGGKNHFNEYKITQSDWDIVKKLNDIISEFYYITKKMEGNIPSASMVLAKYRLLRQYLEDKLSTVMEPSPARSPFLMVNSNNANRQQEMKTPPPPKKNTTLAPGGGLEEDVDFFLDAAPETYNKLAVYLGVVALLAQEYLAMSATSASVEQFLLATVDICGQD